MNRTHDHVVFVFVFCLFVLQCELDHNTMMLIVDCCPTVLQEAAAVEEMLAKTMHANRMIAPSGFFRSRWDAVQARLDLFHGVLLLS